MERVPPGEAAFRILSALFADEVIASPTVHDGTLSRFQERGVQRVLHAIRQHGGVVLADAVGLGKTHMGLAVARHFAAEGAAAVAVVPSALRRQWELPLRRADPDAVLVTHAALSRGGYRSSLVGAPGLLLVDEAHAFRNPSALRYHAIARLAATRRVCLITATPVNNSLWDLYHLLRLFCTNDAFASLGIDDLNTLFAELQQNADRSPCLQSLLRAVLVRRTRADIADEVASAPAKLRFPMLAPPATVPYNADDGSGAHALILRSIGALRFDAFAFESAALVRFLLLKRFASSSVALLKTVRGLMQFQRERLAALREGLLLTSGDARFLGDRVHRDQLVLRPLLFRAVEPHVDVAAIESAVRSDLALLMQIAAAAGSARTDDKLCQLRALAIGRLAQRKVLVFTEFRDTAEYLWRALLPLGGIAMIHGNGAFLGAGRASRAAVVARFAPAANGERRVPARERVRILIATDVLAEGLNLQDCAHVVSYDLPWNPVRLIQRVGRIDRMGSPHAAVHAYNFVPDRQLDQYLSLLNRLHVKLAAIDVAIGLEHVVVASEGADGPDNDESGAWQHLVAHRRHADSHRASENRGAVSGGRSTVSDGRNAMSDGRNAASDGRNAASDGRNAASDGRNAASDEDLRAWLRSAGATYPVSAGAGPCTTALTGVGTAPHATFIVIVDDHSGVVRAYRSSGRRLDETDPCLVACACIEDSSAGDAPGIIKNEVTARRLFRRVTTQMQRSPLVPDRSRARRAATAARLAARLLVSMSGLPGGPDPRQAAHAEDLVRTLHQGHALATEAELSKILHSRGLEFHALAAAIRAAVAPLTGVPERPGADSPRVPKWRLLCAVSAPSRG